MLLERVYVLEGTEAGRVLGARLAVQLMRQRLCDREHSARNMCGRVREKYAGEAGEEQDDGQTVNKGGGRKTGRAQSIGNFARAANGPLT